MNHRFFGAIRLLAGLFGFVALALAARAQATLPNATVGQAYSFTITTSPAAPSGTVYGATNLPSGLSINSSSGTISGTPTTPGTATGTLSLTSGATTNNFSYTLTVVAASGTPSITSSATASGTVNQSFFFTLTASNGPTSYNIGALPAGLSFTNDVNNPSISGTPTSAGTYAVTVSANNASGTGPSSTLTITIAPPGPVPAITSATSATAALNAAFTYTITGSNTPTSFAASGLPLGLSLNTSSGDITGTPTVAGVYTVALTASNANGTGSATNLTLTVGALSVVTTSTLSATAGQSASMQLAATNSPVSFNVSGLPSGLTVNTSTGIISGTPASAGTYTLTVSANNATGTGAPASVTLTVAAAGGGGGGGGGGGVTAPSILSGGQPSNVSVTAGNNASFSVSAVGTGPLTYQWRKNGISINGATGSIYTISSAQASDAGSYTVVVSNSAGTATSLSATLTVLAIVTPVSITTQPASLTSPLATSATFSVVASGSGTLSYQWQKNGVAISGATSASYAIASVQASDAGSYSVVVTNSAGSVTSSTATLTVGPAAPVTVSVQPASQSGPAGTSVTFSVTASGSGTLSYQWQKNGVAISGATSSSYGIASVQASDAGSYAVVITNYLGSATSSVATLTVTPAVGSVSITTQPANQSVAPGGSVTFTLVATGASPISYQWYFNGTAVSGATSSSYSIASAQLSNSGSYSVVATNAVSTVTSSGGILSVTAPSGGPVVTAQPLSQTVATGGTVVFSVTPSGVIQTSSDPSGGLRAQSLEALAGSATSYQWYFNGNVIAGATNSILVIKATTATAGSYSCLIKNSTGSIVSNAATLTVSSTGNPGRLVNLSVNAKLNPAAGTPELIMGFVTGGSGTSGSQSLMIRAAGPALTSYGVPGVLPDPELTAYNGSTSIANNAGWGTPSSNVALVNAAQANTFAGLVYANTASLDSAVVLSLASNPGYTVHVDGKSGDSGQTLAEVYDNTPLGTYALTTPRLVNLSCRITVPANGSLTDGFYIGGTTSKTLLIRAIGPGLTQYGVSAAMQDPQITLYSGSTAIATNAGWGGYAQLTAAMTAVYATPNPPATGDSAILVTLPPGSYTAVATSVSGVAGNVLLDIYEVP